MMDRRLPAAAPRAERGVASLIVVMVLFLIVSMVAAYTNRNLIFEQRTSTNQYRSTQALEAAEAGLEWAKAMLNHGRITTSCQTSTVSTDTSFRQRYLNIDINGIVAGRTMSPSGAQLLPSCVYNAGTADWDCNCPANAAATLTPATSSTIQPAFSVRFLQVSLTQPGLVRIESIGCTKYDSTCLSFGGQGVASESRATLTQLMVLTGGLPSPPQAALTAGGDVNLAGAAMSFYNTDIASGGWTVQASGVVSKPGLSLNTIAGSPGDASVQDMDGKLINTTDRMFSGVFNMWPETYRLQPSTVRLGTGTTGCSAGSCNAAAVRNALLYNPGRTFWIDGNLNVDSAGDIGSATEPAVLIVNGNLTFTSNVTIFGVVYTRTSDWTTSGTGQIQGAVVAEGNVIGAGGPTVVYNPAVLKRTRLATGSVVAVPGGWKDFCSTGTGAPNSDLSC